MNGVWPRNRNKLFSYKTIFNFHMYNLDTIIENIIKNNAITFKNVNQTENKN